ncbi:high-affinity branched-chain amino acid ABC transporter permease LivM [Advenella mimigardefordensis]|uniref:High-affinity branched-chain amino acid transport system permease protein BraE n=1 Tax=Advenella mimigardefordensis (strain DSM 17166 / LMG 22922 / DPN7) TaxID=1247726 RepID=W0PM03_ADVMD|nr:high-affinity branched-chain amino acid ABC transporter permease LivM [Advenella mimigardefordensis]AHG66038.1 high-affinity branched-chain amino acid transport system permease protein BraE [Advenella mimigardefordensis DPN7]
MSTSQTSTIDFGHSLRDAVVAGILTMLVFSPITNFVLKQYSFTLDWFRSPFFLNGLAIGLIVAFVRFFVSVGAQTQTGQNFIQNFIKTEHGVEVEDEYADGGKRLLRVVLWGGGLMVLFLVLGLSGIIYRGAGIALVLVVLFIMIAMGVRIPKRRGKKHPWKGALPVLFLVGLLLPLVFFYFGWFGKSWINNLTLAMVYVLLGLGLNIVVGLAGLLDLGFVAFYAVGAYFLALGAEYLGIGFWTALFLAPLLAALCGGLLGFPVLKMHGDYLAIVTLGFGEIIRLVLVNWISFTGGPNGASVPAPTIFNLEFVRRARGDVVPFHEFLGLPYNSDYRYLFVYLLLFVISMIALRFFTQLRVMPIGRSWEALREDEIACRSLGINHVTVKLSAFMLGAMIGGLAGVFFATAQGFISPQSFNFFESVLILSIVVLGGMGSSIGVIIAAFTLTLLPEFLREFAGYRVLLFGLLMILMMIWRPNGLLRPKRSVFRKSEVA